jgi:hypothetical protein
MDTQRVNLATQKAGNMSGRQDEQQPKRLPAVAVKATIDVDFCLRRECVASSAKVGILSPSPFSIGQDEGFSGKRMQ